MGLPDESNIKTLIYRYFNAYNIPKINTFLEHEKERASAEFLTSFAVEM